MKIVVCMKRVIEPAFPLTLDSKTKTINEENIPYIVNPLDEIAVEAAVRIKEKHVGTEITLVTLDSPSAEETLRNCMAMGGDQIIHVWDESIAHSDAFTSATILAKTIESIGYDLILCGARTLDESSGLIGGEVAEFLGIPSVCGVTEINISNDNKNAKVHRMMERGDKEVLSCSLPALFAVEMGLNTPRYPSLPAKMRAKKKEIHHWNLEKAGFTPEEKKQLKPLANIVNISYPRPRTRKTTLPPRDFSPEERIKFLMEGGITEKGGALITQGAPDEMAEKLSAFLA